MGSYRFGTIEVRTAERRVLVSGAPAALGARAFDLLVALIENRERVMTKDELLGLVWPGLVVEENNLQVQVSTLRKILGNQAISTLPGRGYRFTLSPEDGPGGTPSAAPAHNLPAELNTFVGREAETAQLRELLSRSRLVTLTGAGGTGKSRLSLHLAAAMLPQFPDGAWRAELAATQDERLVGLAIASALGVQESELAARVAGRNLLLILDNCEHLLRGCADASRTLLENNPGLRILATSREALHVTGEATFRVQTLSRPHAIELFVDRARAANPAFEPEVDNSKAVLEICRRLDGMPLAIELAAARVRALSVTRIAERLDDRFRLLVSGDSTAMPHQQTLRASIEWSYELLSVAERALLRRLSVFAGGWSLEAAEAVCGGGDVPNQAVMELLANLVEKSLVAIDASSERYHLLETLREYALEQLEESGEARDIRDMHVQHYLVFASRARLELVGSAQGAWYRRVDEERENILAAQRCCEDSGQALLGLRLVSSLKGYWVNRGLVALARGVILSVLERIPERGRQRARTLYDAGQMAYFMGLFPESRTQLEESLDIARGLDDKVLIGLVLQPLGLACAGAGDRAAARPYLEEAIALAREQQEPRRVAARVNSLAQLHRMEGDFAAAVPLYEHVVELSRGLGDRVSEAFALLNLAMTSADRGDLPRARAALDGAMACVSPARSRVGQSVLEVCAGLAAMASDWDRAARLYGAAAAEAARSGVRPDPADEAFLARHMEKARAARGPEFFAALEKRGRELSYEHALEEARAWLGEAHPH
jgi:predicted ATPase/DNA-binding winged helix-turn-helix (wHTH) protein